MGGDHGPHVILDAVKHSLENIPHLTIIAFGDKSVSTQKLALLTAEFKTRFSYQLCEQTVQMSDKPTDALRKKKLSSMRLALEAVARQEAQACVSSGNTGALMATAFYVLKCLPGIARPALISALPTQKKNKVQLLDLGASVNCDAEALFQYAVMASVLAENCYQIKQPRIALLNVGEEDIKGSSLVKHANLLLSNCEALNYIGYIEGNRIFSGDADVIVTDGFTGNVTLKTSEGIAKFVIDEVRKAMSESFYTKLASKLILPYLKKVYRRMNPDQYNGASLIGLRGIVVKSHGNASVDACHYAILQAINEVEQQVPEKIKTKIENVLLEH